MFAKPDLLYHTYEDQRSVVNGISVDTSAECVAMLVQERPARFPADQYTERCGICIPFALTSGFLSGPGRYIPRRHKGSGNDMSYVQSLDA